MVGLQTHHLAPYLRPTCALLRPIYDLFAPSFLVHLLSSKHLEASCTYMYNSIFLIKILQSEGINNRKRDPVGADGTNGGAYQLLAVRILASFCRCADLAAKEEMIENVPLLLDWLRARSACHLSMLSQQDSSSRLTPDSSNLPFQFHGMLGPEPQIWQNSAKYGENPAIACTILLS